MTNLPQPDSELAGGYLHGSVPVDLANREHLPAKTADRARDAFRSAATAGRTGMITDFDRLPPAIRRRWEREVRCAPTSVSS